MKLENLKIVFLGDSITEGARATRPENAYHQRIKEYCGLAAAYNCGVSGTRIARQTVPSYNAHKQDLNFALRAKVMPKDADMIIIFGGTNDFGHGDAYFGTIDSEDEYTYLGALNCLVQQLQNDFPKARLVFMTPIRRVSEDEPSMPDGKILADYVDGMIEIAKKYKLSVIDLFRSGVIEDPADKSILADGLHPTDLGHDLMARYISEALKKL